MSDDIRELWPEPPGTLRDRLQHFVDSYPTVPDKTVVLMATSGAYGIGVITGLTMGDIRTLAAREALGPETVVYGPEAERLGQALRRKLADDDQQPRDDRGRFQQRGWGNGSAPDQGGPQEGPQRP